MAEKKIITIGRQFGSGGKQIGEALAEKMNIPFYDKELLKEAAKNSGICEEIFDSFDEKPTNSFLYSLVMDPYSLGFGSSTELPLNHKVFLAAFDTIKNLAEKDGSCVFVGRCADYALRDLDNVVNIFLYADMDDRTARIEGQGYDQEGRQGQSFILQLLYIQEMGRDEGIRHMYQYFEVRHR